MPANRDEIKAYIENRFTLGELTLKAMTIDDFKKQKPRRSVALVIDKYLRDFKQGNSEPRWVIIPGLRGVGKTTLVAQLYNSIYCGKNRKIYISLDDAIRSLGTSISEILDVYEEIVGTSFENLTEPVYIFLDEVQYDDSWGITLKNLYDRTKKVFVVCTGSSALSLQTNPDIARRAVFSKLFPLTFTEYQMIRNSRFPVKGLGSMIREILFNSSTAEEILMKLSPMESFVDNYWSNIPKNDFDDYLKFGTLPSALTLVKNPPLIYSQINHTLTSVLAKDVPQLNSFDKQTTDKLGQLLYAVASYDTTSFNNISQNLQMDIKTVTSVFEALEKTELLIRIYPFGSHESQVRKPSKFLFTSPAFRAMYFNLVGSTTSFDNYKGKLFEDVIGLYLHRIFNNKSGFNITYDSAQNGADFIIGTDVTKLNNIIIEAGLGKKGCQQVLETMKKTEGKYGIVVSNSNLRLDNTKKCILIPTKFFLLI